MRWPTWRHCSRVSKPQTLVDSKTSIPLLPCLKAKHTPGQQKARNPSPTKKNSENFRTGDGVGIERSGRGSRYTEAANILPFLQRSHPFLERWSAYTETPQYIYPSFKMQLLSLKRCLCLQTSTRERPWSIGMFSTSYIRIGFVCDLALNLLLIRITLSTFPSSSSNISSSRIGTTWGRNGAAISV